MLKLCLQTATVYLAKKCTDQQFVCVQRGGSTDLGQAQLIFTVVLDVPAVGFWVSLLAG